MATITISVSGVGSKTYTLSSQDANRIATWAQTAYATAPTAENPNPPALTLPQAVAAWADGLIAGTIADVRNAERDAAHRAVAEPAAIITS